MCCHLMDQYLEAARAMEWGKDARLPEFHGPF
jgi:NADH dehydrogenase (ubiquinone) 1 beta subcomplex subunit 10